MAIDSLDLWLDDHIVLHDFFHANMWFVFRVVSWSNAVQMWPVLKTIAQVLRVVPPSTHREHWVGSTVQLLRAFQRLDMHLLCFKLYRFLAIPFVRKLLTSSIAFFHMVYNCLIVFRL